MLPFPKRSFRRLTVLSVAMAAAVLLAACGTEHPQTTFEAQGNSARAILDLYNVIFYVAIGVFVVVEGLLVYSVFRYRRRPEHGIPLQLHGNQPLEITWTIIPAAIVLFLATWTFRTQTILVAPQENPLRVTVTGHQWWWEFQYPDLGIETANEVHLPANRDIELTLESNDVIHSFWIPRLAGKTDVIPGHSNTLTFRADDTAEPIFIRGQCAEFCGGTHAQMGMYAVVEPQAAFDTWVQQQQADANVPAGVTPVPATPPEVTVTAVATTEAATAVPIPDVTEPSEATPGASLEARGYEFFDSKGCVACHAIQGYPGAEGQTGPDLTHVGSREHIVAGWLLNTPENMQRWLRDPNEVKPGNIMGATIQRDTLTEDEIEALAAYLESLK